jgi:hypothetical protein
MKQSKSTSFSFTVNPAGQPTEPLLYPSNIQYLGAFRVPALPDQFNTSLNTYDSGGTSIAYNPANNSLFIVGMPYYQEVSEISIPALVNSTNLSSLNTCSVLQAPKQFLPKIPNDPLRGQPTSEYIGGLLVYNGKLLGTDYLFYDANGAGTISHFTINSLTLSSASVSGLFQVGTLGGGYVAGYMAPIPSEWKSALGAPYLTGQGDLSIISRTSNGPGVFGFDPSTLGSSPSSAVPYVYYNVNNPLGPYEGFVSPIQSGTTTLGGVVFVPGTSSVLFFGGTGTNYDGYGEGSAWGDNVITAKGPHSLNGEYAFQVWAYNVNDLISVKNGSVQPWQVAPYAVWNFATPFNGGFRIGGVAFDQSTNKIYISVPNADTQKPYSSLPVIYAFQVNTNTPSSAPYVGTLCVTPNNQTPGPIPQGTSITIVAGNVYGAPSTTSISQVSFFLDSPTGQLVGNGSPGSGFASHTYSLSLSSASWSKATHKIYAVATDKNGVKSTPLSYSFTIS